MAEQRPVADAIYRCYLSDGSHVAGVTDADGHTGVITTSRQADVLQVTVAAHPDTARAACCDAPERWWENEALHIDGDGSAIATTTVASTPPVISIAMPKGTERPLTTGEEKMARTVFGHGINYAKVKIHHGGWWLFVGNQDPNTAVTPNGKIYVPTPIYRDDYSTCEGSYRRLFIHEMVHVWQFQMGYNIKLNALRVTSRGPSAYVYDLSWDSRLSDFNMEQQGDIMSDYYMICIERNPRDAYNSTMDRGLLHLVMRPFVDPRNKAHLPAK